MTRDQSATAHGAVAAGATWEEALEGVLSQTGESVQGADLALVFASHVFAPRFDQLLARVHELTGALVVAGCSGQAIIGAGREIERQPAVSLLAATLPGVVLHPMHITQTKMQRCNSADDWLALIGVAPEDVNAWIILADPFRLDIDALLAGLSLAYPAAPLIGGLASGDFRARRTHVFFNAGVYDEGAVLIGIGGAYTIQTVVAQGAQPIGETWTVTGAEGQWITSIGGRQPAEVLNETVQTLSAANRARARNNLLVGLAMDEYKTDFVRGDFLIRNLMGSDQPSGALAVSDLPRVGQTVQFQLRDSWAADTDLKEMLIAAKAELGDSAPVAALLCSCNGRGENLFGVPHHDAAAVAEHLGPVPLAGFFCNGEIGPVGGRPYVHGFTASLGLIVPVEPSPAGDGGNG